MGNSGDKRDPSKGQQAAGAAGTAAAAGAAVAGAQSFLFGDEAEALDLDTPIDLVVPAVDLGAHAIEADAEFGDDDLADDIDALLIDDLLLGTADVLDHDASDLIDGLDDPLDEGDDLGRLGDDDRIDDLDNDPIDPDAAEDDPFDLG